MTWGHGEGYRGHGDVGRVIGGHGDMGTWGRP